MSPGEPSVFAAFEACAERHAERVALEADGLSLSYRKLRRRARQIARQLRQSTGEGAQRVALLLGHVDDAIPAMLGVLGAGHAYVPLDPADPPERLRLIAAESGAQTVLTDGSTTDLARQLAPGTAVLDVFDAEQEPASRLPWSARGSDAIAYLMYTSGSTGRPKGVLQTHGNLLHFVRSYAAQLGITPRDRLSLLFSLGFSAANMDVYGALLNGATLCPYNVRELGVLPLLDWIEETELTVLHAVPTLLRHVLDLDREGRKRRLGRVRAVDLGGEPVYASDLALVRARLAPDCMLVNHYAATEASVIAQQVLGERTPGAGVMPVGRPAPGIAIRVVREDGAQAAPGETGEIVVSSPFLSPGYHGRPDLSAAAFAEDPTHRAWRTYRTGDFGRLDAEGRLWVTGRSDARVKIRGHAVDLTEVEAALCGLDGVKEAVVVARPEAQEAERGLRLVAQVAAKGQDARSLRRELAKRLPPPMLPAELHVVDALARTATGKIDRRALASGAAPSGAREFEAPTDPLEQRVAAIFAQQLHAAQVGRRDDFFELGGDSLGLAQLQSELVRAAGVELAVGDLLDDATVADVAASLRRQRETAAALRGPGRPLLVALRRTGSQSPLFVVHGRHGQALVSPAFLRGVDADRPVMAFRARGLEPGEVPHRRVRDAAADYVAAMRQAQPRGPYLLAGICGGGVIAHEMACQLERAGESLALLLLIDPSMPPAFPWRRRMRELAALYLTRLPLAPASARRAREQIAASLRRRQRQGRTAHDGGDPERERRAVRVAADLRIALRRHRMGRYSGAVHFLAKPVMLLRAFPSVSTMAR